MVGSGVGGWVVLALLVGVVGWLCWLALLVGVVGWCRQVCRYFYFGPWVHFTAINKGFKNEVSQIYWPCTRIYLSRENVDINLLRFKWGEG